jgi:DNA-binding response OmpR family regulator
MNQPLAYVVEDDPAISDLFAIALREAGFRAVEIGDGALALQKMKEERPDLVLLDLRLPSIPGIVVLQEMRKDERLKDVRVIVASADATQTTFLREQADLVLVKPVGYNQLRELATRLRTLV